MRAILIIDDMDGHPNVTYVQTMRIYSEEEMKNGIRDTDTQAGKILFDLEKKLAAHAGYRGASAVDAKKCWH